MTEIILYSCLGIFLIEMCLILKELRRINFEKRSQSTIKELQEQKDKLNQRLNQALSDVEGINHLWNQSIMSEQKLRKELEVTKVQMVYLAQKVVKAQEPVLEAEEAETDKKSYWEKSSGEAMRVRYPMTEKTMDFV
ncbi:hypothetical protein [Bdellovibrio bacteriovorus]|uniref:Uncharacterized protein n=1 Tax=Bdellovibrio bacteriovorus TaxID=959 RepID=A0A1Z3NC27_BDEBC|nr:hypothetical protein [Bdellovibrio bacteriovorus]ASD65032.1 hypothetical protein B9G79_16385 [Bdellovibrio bacteriovorus]